MTRFFTTFAAACVLALLLVAFEAAAKDRKSTYSQSSSSKQILYLQAPDALNAGRKHLKKGNPQLAIAAFDRVIADKNSKSRYIASAYNGRCAALIRLRRYKEALESCNRSIEIAPNRWEGYNNKGTAYFHLGHLRFAIDAFQAGRELAPKNRVLSQNIKLVRTHLESLTGGYQSDDKPQL